MHLATHPNGGVSLCCRSNHVRAASWAKQPGSVELQTLDDATLANIANSETFVAVREAMLSGQRPTECEGCWQDEAAGVISKRQQENQRWAHLQGDLENTSVLSRPAYRYVELRLGNTCNSACVTCNSWSSSRWNRDEQQLAQDLDWFRAGPQENFRWSENDAFYEQLADLSPDVEEIYINGGEPTLIKAHFRYLERLVESGQSQQVHLVYNINMTGIPERLLWLWERFQRVTVNCSIDDVGERNRYIRWPTVWADVERCLASISSAGNIQWNVTQTVSIYNISTLGNLEDWFQDRYSKIPIHNHVLYPAYLSLSAVPDALRIELAALYSRREGQQWQDLVTRLSGSYDAGHNAQAAQFVRALDLNRGIDFRDFVPELARIIG